MSIISLHPEDLFGIAAGTKQEIKSEEVDDVKSDCMFNSGLVYWKNEQKHNIEKTLQEEDSEESKGQYVIKLEANPDDADEANPDDADEDTKIVAELITGDIVNRPEIDVSEKSGYSDLDSINILFSDNNSVIFEEHSDNRPHLGSDGDAKFKEKCHTKYSDNRPFPCSDCDARFKEKGALNRHMRLKHSDNLPFPCRDCDARFKERGVLNKHLRTKHSDNRPYQCVDCDARFKSKKCLTAHLRYTHSNIRPFSCSDCDAKFKAKGSLKKHLLSKHIDIQ